MIGKIVRETLLNPTFTSFETVTPITVYFLNYQLYNYTEEIR